jgi:hypothetical protein
MNTRPALAVVVCTAFLLPAPAGAQHDHSGDRQPPPASAAHVDFGILPTAPLGPLPCLQTGAIGGPADPCSYKLHVLTPEETTVAEGGEVTFQIHGGGHAMAIYEVSRNTRRDEVGQYLCAGLDPAEIADPTQQPCNAVTPAGAANAAAMHVVRDGRRQVVLVADPNITNVHPDNRVWSVPGRLMSAGGQQFLNGGALPVGPTTMGQLVTYRFLEKGRYLVICMNRSHFLNDWMFGFVNVVESDRNGRDDRHD